ncbi:MAG TPA: tripartite tricarboxylate transporter substrate binding protein [Eoetvoesiella sp.]
MLIRKMSVSIQALMKKWLAFVMVAMMAVLPGQSVVAQTAYPSGPIRLIVPFGAGGLTDILARVIAEHLNKGLGWNMVVENKVGAGGSIGAEYVARSQPNGLTLLMGSIGTNATNPYFYNDLRYDPKKDFAPVALAASGTLLLVANPSLPIHNMKELIAYAKNNPGKLSYASGGVGTSQHLAGELLKSMAKIDVQHVPYKGISPSMTDLLGGRVSMTFDMATVLPYVKEGKMRPIAVANPQRSSALPEVPTIAEAGVPGYAASAWYGVFAPRGTPDAVVQKLNAEINKVISIPAVREQLLGMGAETSPMSAAQFAKFVNDESVKWGGVLKGISVK